MSDADFQAFVPAGLTSLGIEADETELAVMSAAHELYWPAIRGLLDVDLSGEQAEHNPDLRRAP